MKTIKKQNSNYLVKIRQHGHEFMAFYMALFVMENINGGTYMDELVFEIECFANMENAEKWAAKKLAA